MKKNTEIPDVSGPYSISSIAGSASIEIPIEGISITAESSGMIRISCMGKEYLIWPKGRIHGHLKEVWFSEVKRESWFKSKDCWFCKSGNEGAWTIKNGFSIFRIDDLVIIEDSE